MNGWLLSIAGIVIIGVLVEVLLSDSSIHKFVRSIYAFFVLFIIAQPIPGFFRDAAKAVETGGAIELDTELIDRINSQTAAARQKNAQLALEQAGFSGVIVTIHGEMVFINAYSISIEKKPDIIKIVRAVTGVSEEGIYYVG